MRILLCLLSGQHVPNLLTVHHFKPDRLVLIESEDMKKKNAAENLLSALRQGGLDYDGRVDRVPLDHEDSLPDVRRALQAAYGRHPSAEWIVNVTGGTKPMSIAAYQFFSVLAATQVYLNVREPGKIQWLGETRIEDCAHRPTIAEFLAGYGFASRKATEDVAKAERRAEAWWGLSRTLAKHAIPDDLLRFERDERDKARKKGILLEPRHLNPTAVESEEVRRGLVETFGLIEADATLTGKLNKYQAEFLTGGWLEVFFWGLLDHHREALGISDVRLGLMPACGDTVNDFDVAFMHNHRLVAVECKTGGQEHETSREILYKIEAIVRQFRALNVRTVLATTSDFLFDKKGQIEQKYQDRADIYQCTLLTREPIRALATTDDPVPALKQGMRL